MKTGRSRNAKTIGKKLCLGRDGEGQRKRQEKLI